MFLRLLHKRWLIVLLAVMICIAAGRHPIYVSVTEIEHNAKNHTLEVSCKLFIDDFEQTLRKNYKTKIDLLEPSQHAAMDRFVADYIRKHLKISADGKACSLKYIGYERIDEGIYSYFEAEGLPAPKKISISNTLLYEYKKEQISLMHVIINDERKSTKLVNPDTEANLVF